jgi:response regulator RpfG family c-di-GMP phosphodiesterase
MVKSILILDDNSEALGGVIKKLASLKLNVRVCFSPDYALKEIKVEAPALLIAAGRFSTLTAADFAAIAYQTNSIPSFVVLDKAGDETQGEMRRHPGILATYFKPLNEEKLLARVKKFFETLGK